MQSRKPARDPQGSPSLRETTGYGGVPGCLANHAILEELLRTCCQELMRDYGLVTTSQADRGTTEPVTVLAVGTIDFAPADFRGTIGLRMTPSMVERTYYFALGDGITAGSLEAQDWTCELLNQLQGRLKNKLRSFQIHLDLNGPKSSASASAGRLESGLRQRFQCERGQFTAYLDVLMAPGTVLVAQEPDQTLPEEGDLLLF